MPHRQLFFRDARLSKTSLKVMPSPPVGQLGSLARHMFAVLLCALCWGAPAEGCSPDRIDEQVRVDHIYDGDTVKLIDGRRLRLIGIDTPEIGRDGEPSEPFAKEAHEALRELLKGNETLHLRLGKERKDRYGRLLAHLFLEDNTSVEAWLLEQGLARWLMVPPNDWNLACYQAAEQRARSRKLGIWSLPNHQVVTSGALPAKARGFHLIKGRVLFVGESRHAIWLNLPGDVGLRIDRDDLSYFRDQKLERMEGQFITARGWLQPRERGFTMDIRHPAALEFAQ